VARVEETVLNSCHRTGGCGDSSISNVNTSGRA
jgi:hypothetical protein